MPRPTLTASPFRALRSWLSRPSRAKAPKRAARAVLGVSTLEDRLVPAAFVNTAGDLQIDAGNGNDAVTVRLVFVSGTQKTSAQTAYRVVENGVTTDFPAARVTGGDVVFRGNGGNDRFENTTALGSVATGGIGADTLIGGPGSDYLYGNAGQDSLSGNGGSDVLYADSDVSFADLSANYVYGGDGVDYVHGAAGRDFLDGGRGADYLYGYGGKDRMYAALGVDDTSSNYFSGGDENDAINGGAGRDTVDAGGGNDLVHGLGGDDQLRGDGGADFLTGGDGNDSLAGGEGNDTLYGGDADDTLYGGGGIDLLFGEGGNDGLFAGVGDGKETLNGGTGFDRFLVPAYQSGNAEDVMADKTSTDARIVFKKSPAISGLKFNGQSGTHSFEAGVWDDGQVERVDVALANLHRHTGNTRLLKTAGKDEMSFLAVGKQTSSGFQAGGWNSGSEIAFVNLPSISTAYLERTVYHEIGHNWDETDESAHVDDFRAVSGWIERNTTPSGYTASLGVGDKWQYLTAAAGTFARDYGKTNPLEDMATTWEAYFVFAYHGGAAGLTAEGLIRSDAKWATLDALFAQARKTP